MTDSLAISEDTIARVRKVLKEYAQLETDAAGLALDDDLYGAGMTSRASVSLMLALESEFDVEFPDSLLRRDVFESVRSIGEAVTSLVADR